MNDELQRKLTDALACNEAQAKRIDEQEEVLDLFGKTINRLTGICDMASTILHKHEPELAELINEWVEEAMSKLPTESEPVARPVFSYDGPAYVRPCQRGVVINDETGEQIEDFVSQGHYRLSLRFYAKE